MPERKVHLIIIIHSLLLINSYIASEETTVEYSMETVPESPDYSSIYEDYNIKEFEYQDSNDTFHWLHSNSSSFNFTSYGSILPVQLLLDPLYSSLSSKDFLASNDTSNNHTLLPIPQPLISQKRAGSFFVGTSPTSGQTRISLPGIPFAYNDTQTQTFVAISNTLLLLGSFFALQSLPGRILGRSRVSSNNRNGERAPSFPPLSQGHFHPYPPFHPSYYDDEYELYDDDYDYDYDEIPYEDEYEILNSSHERDFSKKLNKKEAPFSSKEDNPPEKYEKKKHIKSTKTCRLKSIKVYYKSKHLLIHLLKKTIEGSTPSPSFPSGGVHIPLNPNKVPQLTPNRKVIRRKNTRRISIPLRRKPHVKKPRRKIPRQRIRRPLDSRNRRIVPNRRKLDSRVLDYNEDYKDQNSGFYYKDQSPFAEDAYARYPELMEWYK
ncbi:unnamed protein product [Lepeophtheirus salmonis]|uniref:(salmon louse) hypothetical protein n=1 Tax=Lepeophtheirus salmonis TaxID=72036 RepID=A0A7R8GZ63_LEPSM|nr:unnamed protein product [Lepeophtheirus salmonis]CAF2758457.1 unnamed protein product [Lepeophtheirus salmonis]